MWPCVDGLAQIVAGIGDGRVVGWTRGVGNLGGGMPLRSYWSVDAGSRTIGASEVEL